MDLNRKLPRKLLLSHLASVNSVKLKLIPKGHAEMLIYSSKLRFFVLIFLVSISLPNLLRVPLKCFCKYSKSLSDLRTLLRLQLKRTHCKEKICLIIAFWLTEKLIPELKDV